MILSYRFRLIGILSVILLVAFISISVLNFRSSQRSLRAERVNATLPLLRENIYSEILSDLDQPIQISSLMAGDSFLISWVLEGETNLEEITTYLKTIQNRYGYFSTFFISEITKNYYHFDGILKQISPADDHDIWYYTFTGSKLEYALDVDTNEAADNRLTIFINFRLEDFAGNLLGVTGVGVEMASFSGFLAEKQQEYNRNIFLVDRDGYIQAHSDRGMIQTASIFELRGISGVAADLLSRRDGAVNRSYRIDQHLVLVTSRYVPELDWYLIVEQDEAMALTAARRNLLRNVLTGVATSIIIIVLSAITVSYFQKRLERMAVTDRLTGAANRREFENQLVKAVYRKRRYGTPFSIILFDIDDFKRINDTIGHLYGDKILVKIADIARENVRPTDVVARWGGDEFVLLAEIGIDAAMQSADRVHQAVLDTNFQEILKREMDITISMGVAEYGTDDSADTLMSRADKALYQSKQAGKNTISKG